MAEKWGQIMHILDVEDKEYEEAMRGQVLTTFPSTNSSNKVGSFKNVYWDQCYCQVYNREEVKIQPMPASKQH